MLLQNNQACFINHPRFVAVAVCGDWPSTEMVFVFSEFEVNLLQPLKNYYFIASVVVFLWPLVLPDI